MADPESVLSFWLDELSPKDWYRVNPELDRMVFERFEQTWREAQEGAYGLWLTYPKGALAYIILNDQLPRNMFRGTSRAFASDDAARAAAKVALAKGWDMRIEEPARQFFYLPLMHSECLVDQDRCVRLMLARLPETGEENLRHAKAHREVIRRFGRFPYRNEALARETTAPEAAFVAEGGYRSALSALSA